MKISRLSRLYFPLVVLSITLVSIYGNRTSCPPESMAGNVLSALVPSTAHAADGIVGSEAAPWTLKDLDGKEVSLSDFEGKVVIIDFWATWCPPCRKGIPELVELQEKYGAKGLSIVGISLDQGGVAPVRKFAEEYKINYPVVMGDEDVVSAYGNIQAIPTAFVIDRKGKIVDKHVGYADKAYFEKMIQPLL